MLVAILKLFLAVNKSLSDSVEQISRPVQLDLDRHCVQNVLEQPKG